jgi:hypothetical protein
MIGNISKNKGGSGGNVDLSGYVKKEAGKGLAEIKPFPLEDNKKAQIIEVITSDGQNQQAMIPAYTSQLKNDSGFVTRKIENFSDMMCADILFQNNTTTICGEASLNGDTLPVLISNTEPAFESSFVFKTGDEVLPISHEGISISWSGEDCDEEGCFYPQPNMTYELHAKRLGDMFSIRVGIIVTPHTEEA